MRIDHDLLGDIEVPDTAYYGAQTQRALELCNPSKEKLCDYPELVYSITAIKKSCAIVHHKLGVLPEDKAHAIMQASDEVMEGKFIDQFPVDIVNGGGCVSVHMNVNEVIANRANEIICGKKGDNAVHGNTHVNMGQSTNDVIPSAIKLALYQDLLPIIESVDVLRQTYAVKAEQFAKVVKVSRTCFQDAVPITLGQFYGASASFLQRQKEELTGLLPDCLAVPLGATAVGTGLGTFKGYQQLITETLSGILGLKVVQEKNLFDGLQYGDLYIKTSSALRSLATGISKMARDIRIMSSGPRAGLGEITIAPVQSGSSIMPGKINPALPELMNVICYEVCGNDVSVCMAVEGGELELNVWEPVIIINLLGSCRMLAQSIPTFSKQCVETIHADTEKCRYSAEYSIALSTVVSALLGYQDGTKVALYATEHGLPVKEAAVQLGFIEQKQADSLLDPLLLTDPEKSGELLLRLALSKREV